MIELVSKLRGKKTLPPKPQQEPEPLAVEVEEEVEEEEQIVERLSESEESSLDEDED
jgi:hypothetical protein